MNTPMVTLLLRSERRNSELRRELRRSRADVAALHEVADTWHSRFREEHDARVDLERLYGWTEAT